jgi:hypothetical protein
MKSSKALMTELTMLHCERIWLERSNHGRDRFRTYPDLERTE